MVTGCKDRYLTATPCGRAFLRFAPRENFPSPRTWTAAHARKFVDAKDFAAILAIQKNRCIPAGVPEAQSLRSSELAPVGSGRPVLGAVRDNRGDASIAESDLIR